MGVTWDILRVGTNVKGRVPVAPVPPSAVSLPSRPLLCLFVSPPRSLTLSLSPLFCPSRNGRELESHSQSLFRWLLSLGDMRFMFLGVFTAWGALILVQKMDLEHPFSRDDRVPSSG